MDIPDHIRFPRTINIDAWRNYLDRDLNYNERYMLENVRSEKHLNDMMIGLYNQCEAKRLFVPNLTNPYGNCMYEALVYNGVCDNVQIIRRSLAFIMYIYKDCKDFFPNQSSTLGELFDMMNDIEYVVNQHRNERREDHPDPEPTFHKYTYNVMCQDMTKDYSWTMLPTQLILMVVSLIFKLDIVVIVDSSNYEHRINVYEGTDMAVRRIYLGKLGESHYLPVSVLAEDEEIEPMYYNRAKLEFLKWGKKFEKIKYDKYLHALEVAKTPVPTSDTIGMQSEENPSSFSNAEFTEFSQSHVNNSNLVDYS